MTGNLFGDRYQVGDTLGFGGMARGAPRPRPPPRPGRRDQGAAGRPGPRPVLPDPLPPRGAERRLAEPPGHRRGLRHRRDPGARPAPVPYIVMEYVDGETLRDLLKREGPLPPKRAMEIVADVCAALDFSHRHGIVHRDIKPANVMLTRAGAVKVMDFGIARAVADGQATMTATAAVIGTAQYLSPGAGARRGGGRPLRRLRHRLRALRTAHRARRRSPVTPRSRSPTSTSGRTPSRRARSTRACRTELDAIVLKALEQEPAQPLPDRRRDALRPGQGAVRAGGARNPADERRRAHRADAVTTGPGRSVPAPPLLAPPSILNSSDDWDQPESSRAKKVWGFVGIGLLCLALLGGAVWFTLRITGQPEPLPQVSVPDLKGMTQSQAAAALQAENLVLASEVKTVPQATRTRARSSTSRRVTTPWSIRHPRSPSPSARGCRRSPCPT